MEHCGILALQSSRSQGTLGRRDMGTARVSFQSSRAQGTPELLHRGRSARPSILAHARNTWQARHWHGPGKLSILARKEHPTMVALSADGTLQPSRARGTVRTPPFFTRRDLQPSRARGTALSHYMAKSWERLQSAHARGTPVINGAVTGCIASILARARNAGRQLVMSLVIMFNPRAREARNASF